MFKGMTLEEAIAHAKEVVVENRKKEAWNRNNPHIWNDGGRQYAECKKCADEHEQLAEWLEELKQYRMIGTLEECREATEKQTAKTIETAWCPCCNNYLTQQDIKGKYYCVYCGQKLDWGDEE